MSDKIITIKLTKINNNISSFDIYDEHNNELAIGVPSIELISGKSFVVGSDVTIIIIKSVGKYPKTIIKRLVDFTRNEYRTVVLEKFKTGTLWAHLKDNTIYNSFYNVTEPYVIEYPFTYMNQDQILQSVEDYSKVYKYFKGDVFTTNNNNKVQVDNEWFNKSILYNGQQSSGLLELDVKPTNNMRAYMDYPKYNPGSKSILWTKVDNVYKYNTFWSLVQDTNKPLFVSTCESLSIDKEINQDNMDYSPRNYSKDTIRSKDAKIRHILDNTSSISIVSQFIVSPTQKSYI